MKKIDASELLDLGAYEQIRARFLDRIILAKKSRRLGVGDHMTFVFENRDTVLFQIQEMLRTERITRADAIRHELETYNDLVPEDGEVSATLFIEYDDRAERSRMLERLVGLKSHITLVLGERRIPAEFRDLPGEEEDRFPAVTYLRFRIGEDGARRLSSEAEEAAVEITHPAYTGRGKLPPALRAELARDLRE